MVQAIFFKKLYEVGLYEAFLIFSVVETVTQQYTGIYGSYMST